MKWAICFLSLSVSLVLVKVRWPGLVLKVAWAEPELSTLGCKAQGESFDLAFSTKVAMQGGAIHPPGPDGFFSYYAMGLVGKMVYGPDSTGELAKGIRRACQKLGKAWSRDIEGFEVLYGLTYAGRKQAWDSYQRTPDEYKRDHLRRSK